jgi:hypothetical protein
MIAIHFTEAHLLNKQDEIQRVGCALLALAEKNPTGQVPESIRIIPAITQLPIPMVNAILAAFEQAGWITRGEPYTPTRKAQNSEPTPIPWIAASYTFTDTNE